MADLIDRLRKMAEWPDDYGPASIEDIATEAAAALEAAREDAERYRWLRDSPERPCRVPCAYAVMPGDVEHPTPIGGATLDTAIDQARGKAGQELGTNCWGKDRPG